MTNDPAIDRAALAEAVLNPRFSALASLGIGLSSIATWDRSLVRDTRILIPTDVQALVVTPDATEVTVPLFGDQRDPVPFAAGSVPPVGVHLHWALPDALLAGGPSADGSALALPPLPDRWAVIRTLLPTGATQVSLRGWVIDAKQSTVTPLETYAGTTPAGSPVFDPLDAAYGGSLHWTASYAAASGRFGFHDPLDDLPTLMQTAPNGFYGDHAVYTVAGWWSDSTQDPLTGLSGSIQLDQKLSALGWLVAQDADDSARVEPDPRVVKLRTELGLSAPNQTPPINVVTTDGRRLERTDEYQLGARSPVTDADDVLMAPPLPTYAALVHGSVLGVPIAGALPGADDRPDPSTVGVALGLNLDDVVSAFAGPAFGLDATQRASVERLVAAFSGGQVEELGSSDGIEDLDEREHGDGFWPFAGPALPAMKPDVLRTADSAAAGPFTVGRKGRAAHATGSGTGVAATLAWAARSGELRLGTDAISVSRRLEEAVTPDQPTAGPQAESRQVVKSPPRYFRPQAPMLGFRGAHPNHRHHGDGLYDDNGQLRCRYPKECVTGIDGVVDAAQVMPPLGSGAIPAEVTTVVQEAVVLDPYGYPWLAAAGAGFDSVRTPVSTSRLAAEMVRLYGTDGIYDGSSHLAATLSQDAAPGQGYPTTWASVSPTARLMDTQIASVLSQHSLVAGTPPSPVAITTWRQPWVPLWLEWQVTLDGTTSLDGWTLTGLDLQPDTVPPTATSVTFSGRSPLGQGVSTTLQQAMTRWSTAEQQRSATDPDALSADDQTLLGDLIGFIAPLDLMSASLDGMREQLMGLPYVGVLERPDPGDGAKPLPDATGLPTPLFGGTVTLDALRLVDAFGRFADVPVTAVGTTDDLSVDGLANGCVLRPRIQHAARWLFRLVDPAQPPGTDPTSLHEAFIDQIDPTLAVNPVAGFLLPDHIDESLEVFTVDGDALGSVETDDVSGAIVWEPSPGRPVPPDAGPLSDIAAHDRFVAEVAAGLVRADAVNRAASPPETASTLTALLRAIDTTLWSVDTFAAVGSPTVAGLVGRPVAVVRASLQLDAPDDLDEVTVSAPGGADARRAAFAALETLRFPVHLGVLARSDDSLLGFYVDDDYDHLHLVDKVIASNNIASGRHIGYLGLLGAPVDLTSGEFDNPYLVDDDTVWIRPGQTVMLTLLMLPAAGVHLTSGILPRKALQLSDGWVTAGLRRLVPTVRVGPLLVDPAEIRLPLVSILGDKQTFTRRTGPLTWRDDAIAAATQTAYLPRLPHEAQEGWIRVTPVADDSSDSAGGA